VNSHLPHPLDIRLMNLATGALLVTFVLLAAVTLSRWISRLPAFDLQGIAVVGDVTHNNALTLRANVAPRLSGTFFTVDLAKVRNAFESVPWVRHAIVRREFPNRLRVALQEHQAVGYWGDEGELRLINSFGEVFEANTGELDQDSLPRLNGPEEQGQEVLAMYRILAPQFGIMKLTIDALELSRRGSWSLRLEGGAAIELGRGAREEVSERTQRFLKTLTQVVSKYGRQANSIESADLRHDNGYAIRLRGVSTQIPEPGKK
jgi:cell division protein FtsQ